MGTRHSFVGPAILRVGVVSGLLLAGAGEFPVASLARAAAPAPTKQLDWIRTAPTQPWILYEGGTDPTACADNGICPSWARRSHDGGRTWADLASTFGLDPASLMGSPVMTPNGRRIYFTISHNSSPDTSYGALVISFDSGGHWFIPDWVSQYNQGGSSNGAGPIGDPAISPVDPSRVYEQVTGGSAGTLSLQVSNDGGRTVHSTGTLPDDVANYFDLVADPSAHDTLYAYSDPDHGDTSTQLARSDDLGGHWAALRLPPGVRPVLPVLDPYEPGLLEIRPQQPGQPADRIYLSADHGRSWRAASCPGRWQGRCPAFTIDNVFGRGHAYALGTNGIYAFDGSGPARRRLAISARLPFPAAQVLDLEGGTRQGDPVYLLGRSGKNTPARVYRSVDRGKSWQLLG